MESNGRLLNKEYLLGELRDNVSDEILKTMWTLPAVYSVPDAVKTVEESYRSLNGPLIRYSLLCGSFSREKIGHWKDYEQLERDMQEISFNDFRERKNGAINRIIKHQQDIDLFSIIKPHGDTTFVSNRLKVALPQANRCLEGVLDFDGFDTLTLTETQVNTQLRRLQRGEITYLHRHEFEVLSASPVREVIPVVVFRDDEHTDPTIKEMIDERLDKNRFRDVKTWYEKTWVPAVKPFRDRFPQLYENISGCILGRLEKDEFKITDPKVVEEVKLKITTI